MSRFNFEELYLYALKNANKPKKQPNWVHVCGLGVSSTRAYELCRHFGIDPEGTDFRKAESKEG
ncbi:hypothetical protein EA758_18050 [Acinetobacter pittii]|uniref:Uncharacterized protein n=1 Tax=Acinetobacter pittii TaxID=48296 RepID=A0AB37TD42_ACIPI|nr:hypothetical protein [Acinetobacter pittii]EKV3813141.1 hypothetical protein [Acinetobacter baumannii]MDU6099230.1 hypothetical protein [Acinetobacter sp.]EKW1221117.1 hypothetical protein [Acinetobacter baumannii]ELB0339162.1 hypothetical protein [Acinetobacter baumannii]ELN4151270.1 hypothetical protein [Acinetobacter baumannii]